MKLMPHAWIDRVTSDHLAVDAELRRLLRQIRARPYTDRTTLQTPQCANSPDRITITAIQARALLRATMPILPQRRRARERHARLFAALAMFIQRLPTLSLDPTDEHVLASARQALSALQDWIDDMAWRRATKAARVSWPAPAAIIQIIQPSISAAVPDLFQPAAPAAPIRAPGRAPIAAAMAAEQTRPAPKRRRAA